MSRPRSQRARGKRQPGAGNRPRPAPPARPERTGAMHRLAAAVHGRVFFDMDPFVLGLYRIALGLLVLLYFVMVAPSWLTYFGPDGISAVPPLPLGDYKPLAPILLFVHDEGTMWLLYGVSLVAAACVTAGVWTRAAVIWLWLINLSLLYRNIYVVNGEEQVLAVLLLFSMFLPLDRSLTLATLRDPARRRRMLLDDEKVRVWALTPLQLHICLLYLLSLPAKLEDSAWRDGTIVYYAMMAIEYPRWPGLEIFAWGNAALSRVLGLGALAIELLVPLLVWTRRWRVACVLTAMGLHLGMGLLIEGVMLFNAAMIVALVLFLPSRRTRAWLARRLGVDGPRAP